MLADVSAFCRNNSAVRAFLALRHLRHLYKINKYVFYTQSTTVWAWSCPDSVYRLNVHNLDLGCQNLSHCLGLTKQVLNFKSQNCLFINNIHKINTLQQSWRAYILSYLKCSAPLCICNATSLSTRPKHMYTIINTALHFHNKPIALIVSLPCMWWSFATFTVYRVTHRSSIDSIQSSSARHFLLHGVAIVVLPMLPMKYSHTVYTQT